MIKRIIITMALLTVPLTSAADRAYLESMATRDGNESGHTRLLTGYRYESNGEILWNLEVHGDIKRWPDVKQSFKITVAPTVA